VAVWVGGHAWDGTAEDVPSANLNTIVENGVYDYASTDTGAPIGSPGVVLHMQRSSTRAIQISGPCTAASVLRIFWRERCGDTGWSVWREFMHSGLAAEGMFKVTGTGIIVGDETDALNTNFATYGASINGTGETVISCNGALPLRVKREAAGTTLMGWYSGETNVGAVTVSGGVVTYGSFCGSHWSQFTSLAKPDILRGTILETTDRMCVWDGKSDDVLPQVRIASAKSKSVYGVFSHWDDDSRDLHVASLGTIPVRIAPGAVVRRGDLIESDGNGMGVPQADDVFRASTVGKVIASARGEKYPDGSFLIPCSIHCG
jgi:hypothetical protein